MAEEQVSQEPRKRRSKRFLTPSQKYEIWLQLLRQEVTMAEAAEQHRVDRSTVVRIRQVAKDGALAALSASKPGVAGKARDSELEAAKAEVARLSEAICECGSGWSGTGWSGWFRSCCPVRDSRSNWPVSAVSIR